MERDFRTQFWEIVCSMSPLLYFLLVVLVALLLLSVVAVLLDPGNRATRLVMWANLVVSTLMVGVVAGMLTKCWNR